MDSQSSQYILDWAASDLSTLIDPSDDHIEEIQTCPNYEDFDHFALGTLAKTLSDGLEGKIFSLSLADNLESTEKRKVLTERLEKSIDKTKIELNLVKDELNTRPTPTQVIRQNFPFPRAVQEYVKDLNLSLLSQILGGSFGDSRSEFHQRYLTFVEYCRSYDVTYGQIEQVFRLFLRGPMLTFWLDLETSVSTIEKLRSLLTINFQGPTISDRLKQLRQFERNPSETLQSAILRLGIILDKTESLVPQHQRDSRKELILCSAISRLAIPPVRSIIERFKGAKG